VGGIRATATPTISGGEIVGYVVTNPGSGYTIVPGVTIQDQETQGVSSISVTLGGSGYTSNTTVSIAPPEISTGVRARARPIINDGTITGFKILTSGSGYTSVPDVTIEDSGGGSGADGLAVLSAFSGGSGAVATAVINSTGGDAGQVTGVVITNPGSGYVLAPSVFFSGGGGSGAIAVATIDSATVTDSVTFTLTGSSSSLIGSYSGVWKSNTGTCSVETSGTVNLSRL
jgi:hypothetical protein